MSANNPAVNRGDQIDDHQSPNEVPDAPSPITLEPGTNVDLTTVLRDVLSTAAHSADADGGFILVLDEGGWPSHWFVLKDGKGQFVPPLYGRASVELGIVGWVIQQQRGDVVDDLASDSRWAHLPPSVVDAESGSAVCLPLEAYGQVIGVLGLVHRTPGFFKPLHQTRLQSIVDRAVPSIENARLREIVRRRTEEMAALYEVALNITADQPLDRLLDTVVAQAMDLLRCQGGGLYLWREDESELEMVSAYDSEIDLRGTRVAPGEGLAGRVFETGGPLILDEYSGWLNQTPHIVDASISSRLPSAAAIAAPVLWQGQPLGVLVTTDRTPGRHFDHNDQRLLTLLANQAGAAIASVQLHDQTSRRLQELVFLNRTIQDITATLDLDEIFAVLTRRVKDLLGIEACSIALVDRETDELVFRFASGGGSETVTGERVPWGQGIVGAAAESGKPVNVSDVSQDVRFFHEIDRKQDAFVTQSILAVPMISQGQVVGVVEGLNKPGGFNREDERLLSALASLAASVVENADLVSARRELEQLRENLTHMIIHDLRSPVGTISNSLELLGRLAQDEGSEQAAYLIGIASRANQRLMNLVDSLLDISRLESGQDLTDLQPISIKTLIRSAVDQFALHAQRKRMLVSIHHPDHVPLVLADSGMIERVLINLVGNAFKFTPSQGEVSVSIEVAEDTVCVRVRDSGPGISPQHRQRIFDKFTRVQKQDGIGGIGLGLAFCRLAVEAHGGRIWVESAEGQGSTFAFTLPRLETNGG